MNRLYKLFNDSLPQFYNFKYNDVPIMYLYDGRDILGLYSFDNSKKVLYYENIITHQKDYISLFEVEVDSWEVISKSKAYNLIIDTRNEVLPF